MEDIQQQAFNNTLKRYDLKPADKGEAAFYFAMGWIGCENWHNHQNQMDKDYQEELQEQERLRRGNG